MIAQFKETISIVPTSSVGEYVEDSVNPTNFLLPVSKEVQILSVRSDIIPIGSQGDITSQTIIPEWYRSFKILNGNLGFGFSEQLTRIPQGTVASFSASGPWNSADAMDRLEVVNTLFMPVTDLACSNVFAKGIKSEGLWYRTITGGQEINLQVFTTIQYERER